jgi:phosphate transport system permease protein
MNRQIFSLSPRIMQRLAMACIWGGGVTTAIILCAGRTIEETACLCVTLGGSAAMPTSLLSGGRTLSLHVFYLAMETRAFDKAMATGAVLIVTIIVINSLTNWLSYRFQTRLRGTN